MTQMGATRQLEAVRRTGYSSSRGWLARVFWPKVSCTHRCNTRSMLAAVSCARDAAVCDIADARARRDAASQRAGGI
jgi:hypothetical protein